MKKNGFTLIELLAVIVILAVIALIATPTVLDSIAKANKGAREAAAAGFVEAYEYSVARAQLDSATYTAPNASVTLTSANISGSYALKGKRPTAAVLNVSNGVVLAGVITVDGKVVTMTSDSYTSAN